MIYSGVPAGKEWQRGTEAQEVQEKGEAENKTTETEEKNLQNSLKAQLHVCTVMSEVHSIKVEQPQAFGGRPSYTATRWQPNIPVANVHTYTEALTNPIKASTQTNKARKAEVIHEVTHVVHQGQHPHSKTAARNTTTTALNDKRGTKYDNLLFPHRM